MHKVVSTYTPTAEEFSQDYAEDDQATADRYYDLLLESYESTWHVAQYHDDELVRESDGQRGGEPE